MGNTLAAQSKLYKICNTQLNIQMLEECGTARGVNEGFKI